MLVLLQTQLLHLQLFKQGGIDLQISNDIAAIGRYLRRHRNSYMEPFGLKSLHARFLIEICRSPGISQDGLTQLIGFDKSNVARQAALLEEQGFLTRRAGEDKRVLRLYPTEKTLALLPGLQDAMDIWEQDLLRNLTPEERTLFAALLTKIRIQAEKED